MRLKDTYNVRERYNRFVDQDRFVAKVEEGRMPYAGCPEDAMRGISSYSVRRDRGLPPVVDAVGKAKAHAYLWVGAEATGTCLHLVCNYENKWDSKHRHPKPDYDAALYSVWVLGSRTPATTWYTESCSKHLTTTFPLSPPILQQSPSRRTQRLRLPGIICFQISLPINVLLSGLPVFHEHLLGSRCDTWNRV